MKAVGVCIAGQIQPVTCHMFAIGRALRQAFNQLFDCLRRRIRDEGVDLLGTRGEPDEIKINAPDEGFRLGERGRFQSFAFKTTLQEEVNGVTVTLRNR